MFFSCTAIKVAEYNLPVAWPEEVPASSENQIRLLHISDFHSNYYGEGQEEIVSLIRESRADVCLITGDFFGSYKSIELIESRCVPVLEALRDLCPFYYVSGNHEYYRGRNDDMSRLIEEYGGVVVNNRTVLCRLGNADLLISGLADPYMYLSVEYRDKKHDDMMLEPFSLMIGNVAEEAGRMMEEESEQDRLLLSVLLAHRPEFIDEYLAPGVFDIILCGHVHGGQWRFPPLINGLYSTYEGFFPSYPGGEYRFAGGTGDGPVMIVSRGLSYQSPDFPRIFNPPELVVIDVIPDL